MKINSACSYYTIDYFSFSQCLVILTEFSMLNLTLLHLLAEKKNKLDYSKILTLDL